MKLIFAGTPEFAAAALDALIAAGHEIALVLTQPDRAAGRGMRIRAGAVKRHALVQGLRVLQPESLGFADVQRALREADAEAMVVAGYGLILPAAVLTIPARGCLNIHASLLPRWRGAAPIQRALLAGDRETGITIMQMNAGLDTGPIVLQKRMAISDDDTAQTLHDKLALLGARAIEQALDEPTLQPQAQDATLASYAEKIAKAEAQIDWTRSAQVIGRQIRAFDPAPGATTTLSGTTLKIWRARSSAQHAGMPGEVIAADSGGIVAAAGEGALVITELQLAGARRLPAAAFLAGHALPPGSRLGT